MHNIYIYIGLISVSYYKSYYHTFIFHNIFIFYTHKRMHTSMKTPQQFVKPSLIPVAFENHLCTLFFFLLEHAWTLLNLQEHTVPQFHITDCNAPSFL